MDAPVAHEDVGPVLPDTPSGADAERDAELSSQAAAIFDDAFSDNNALLTSDKKKILFLSNRDGFSQIYIADAAKPESAATRLVQTSNRITEFNLTRDGKYVVFLSDKDGDENFSVFRVALDGNGLVELTLGEALRRDYLMLPEKTPGTLFYSARASKEAGLRIYSLEYDKGAAAPKLLFRDPSSSFLFGVSPDGKSALLIRRDSMSDTKLVRVDLSAGTSKVIYPPDGKIQDVQQADFSPDGRSIVLSTDDGGEKSVLLKLDSKTLAETARYVETDPATARIDNFSISRRGDKIGIVVDAGNHGSVRILDVATLKPTSQPKMPLGSGSGPRFSDDGSTLTLHWSTPSVPTEVYAIDAKTGDAHPLRKEPRARIAGLPGMDATITEVASFDALKIPANLYLPSPLVAQKSLPTIVYLHGGPASSSAVRWSTFFRFFSAHGFAIVEPNIRGSSGFGRAFEQADDGPKRLDSVKDLEAVGRWAAQQPWADPDRLVVFGGSYGGYMTLMGLTRQPTIWKAGIDMFGVYNWNTMMKATSGVLHEIFLKEIGPDSDPGFRDSVSPSSSIDSAIAPLFVYAGANDKRVPRAESDQIVRSLRRRKVPVEYMVAMNEGHSINRKETITAFLGRTVRFLENALHMAK